MPINAQPSRGYGDWDRVENWDSGLLWSASVAAGASAFTSPTLDVSRYAYIGGTLRSLANDVGVTFAWFADSALTVPIGVRLMTLSATISNSAQLRIPNLGPFLVVQSNTGSSVTFGYEVRMIGTNRYHPLELIPVSAELIAYGPVTLANGAAVIVSPSSYYSGPVRVYALPPAAGWTVELHASVRSSQDAVLDSVTLGTTRQSFTSLVPPDYWYAEVFNQSGANGTLSFAVTATMTGSS